jgi:hypothetical protein
MLNRLHHMETMDTLLLMLSLMAASSLIPIKVWECGGKLLSREESNGSGKLESGIEETAAEKGWQERR